MELLRRLIIYMDANEDLMVKKQNFILVGFCIVNGIAE